jgi:hypothetical protein
MATCQSINSEPTIITAEQAAALRTLQQELSAEGHDYAREAKVKRLCARVLRENGYTAEARSYARQASLVGGLDRAIKRDLRAFDKNAREVEAWIDREILEGVRAGKLTRSGSGEHIADDELIGLPEWASAPAA